MHFSTIAQTGSTLWQAGAVVAGRYRLGSRLTAGGMGEVWKAEHLSLGTAVAIKLVDIAARPNPDEILARFQQEARAAAQLKSAYVVQILDHGVDGGIAFIVMELLEGESLEQLLERRRVLLPSEVAQILMDVCRGVARAHAAGIIHRDLKPANIFLTQQPDGAELAKVLDFGIAKVLGTPANAHLQTQSGLVIGTPAYMSPEQVLGRPLDPRSDLWSLAVIAHEALTGRRLFEGETLGQIFVLICEAPIPPPSMSASVPPGFDAWFKRATDREPAGRFQSARELAEELCRALELPDLATTNPALRPRAEFVEATWSLKQGGKHDAAPHPRAARARVASLLALAAVAAVGGGLWAVRDRPGSPAAAPPAPPSAALTSPTALAPAHAPPSAGPLASVTAGLPASAAPAAAPPASAASAPERPARPSPSAPPRASGNAAPALPSTQPRPVSAPSPAPSASDSHGHEPDFGF